MTTSPCDTVVREASNGLQVMHNLVEVHDLPEQLKTELNAQIMRISEALNICRVSRVKHKVNIHGVKIV